MANRYWVGGAGTWNNSSTANWSATSGGASGASAPTTSDDVFFDSATTYTVTCANITAQCRNITVSAGTVTFNTAVSGSTYIVCAGNISMTAATIFTAPTDGHGILNHQPTSGAATVAFGSSTTNTQKIYYQCSSFSISSLTFCTAATQTFHAIEISINKAPFTCAGSTITVDNQNRVTSGLDDIFSLSNIGGMTVGATTIRMGTTTVNGGDTRAVFTIQSYPLPATEPTLTNFNVTYIRTYNRTQWNTKWYDTFDDGFAFRFGALTFLSNNTNTHDIIGVYGTNSTFTATNINLNFKPQFTGAVTFTGAFSLAGSLFTYDTSNSSLSSLTFSSTTTSTVSNAIAGDLDLSQVDAPITFTGAVTLTGNSTDSALLNIQNSSYTTLFSSTITSTWAYFYVFSNNITFTGSASFTDPSYINTYAYTTFTISNALSVLGSATRPDALDSTFSFSGATLSTSSTATNFTFQNARPTFSFANAMTISNPVSLASNGGLYFRDADLTISNALSSTGVSTYNILACIDSVSRTLTLNGAVSLVNCQLASSTITVAGGATKTFAYSLSTPIPNNIKNLTNTTVVWGNPKAANYPEICADTFTLSASGATFSLTGGSLAAYRTFVRPYTLSGSPACAFNLPSGLTPTFTDVDFWRVTAGGTITKPLTGTRLGNVGTITNITTATPKTVYWVDGTGSWINPRWALTSGGTGNSSNYPLPQDTVIFDANSGTGNFTYPASSRVGSIDIQNVPAGTSAVYCSAVTITSNNAPAYLWVSSNINGPSSTPTGTFVLGNDSTDTYNSFNTGYVAQCLIIADGSSGATHELKPTNLTFMRYNSMQFATLGTTTISGSMTEALYLVDSFTGDTYTANITAAQIGSSSFDYGLNTPATFALGSPSGYGLGSGTVNYGSSSIYTNRFYPSTLTSNTAYSINAFEVYAVGSTTLGNVNFNQGNTGSTNYQFTVDQAITLLNLSVLSKSNFTGTTLRVSHFGSAPRTISMYSLAATYSGSLSTMTISQNGGTGKPTFVKLGGGSVGVSGVNVTNIDASPASTWFTTGTITTSTGWNAGAGPNSKGGFLLFQ